MPSLVSAGLWLTSAQYRQRSMRHAVFIPPAGETADPHVLVDLAVTAEDSGWDAVFIWDHVLRPAGEPQQIADPWVALAAIAAHTSTIRLGPMVTPITRRRPIKLAREALTLDHLSRGRLTMGLGLGVDSAGELSKFGEVVEPVERGKRLDEGAELLSRFWTGQPVTFEGDHFQALDVTVQPTPVQRPRIPLWFASRGNARKPVRRAARYDGLFPIDVHAHQLGEILEIVSDERGGLDGFDIACRPSSVLPYRDFEALGVTWALSVDKPGSTLSELMKIAQSDPIEVLQQA